MSLHKSGTVKIGLIHLKAINMNHYTIALLDQLNERLSDKGHGRMNYREAEEIWGISEWGVVSDEVLDKWIDDYYNNEVDDEPDPRVSLVRRRFNKSIDQENGDY